MSNILIIPDIQAKPGSSTRHIRWLCKYIISKKPDCIVQLGDLWDIPSLSSYDIGKKSAEGKRLCMDVDAGMKVVNMIMQAIKSVRGYKPKLIYVEGNHEYRIRRYENDFPALDGSLFNPVDYMADLGWDSHPFLSVTEYSGISFSHFFPRTIKGTTSAASQRNGPSSASAMVRANMTSCIGGHKQGLDVYIHNLNSHRVRGIIAGSFYLHDEGYHSAQGHSYWRGILMLNNVKNGDYDLTEVSIDYLRKKYG